MRRLLSSWQRMQSRQGFHSPYFIVPKKGGQQPQVCSDRPEGRLHSCFDPSVTQTFPTVCILGLGMVVQGPPPWALPVSPCLYEGHRGRPYPATGSGRQGPQLPRRLACLGPIQRAVVRSQGLGASAPQPVGASGQTGKGASSPLCRESLFSVWS